MRDRFEFGLEVLKAEEREGRPVITIYATDTARDREKERCSDECLDGLVKQIRAGGVELLNTHMDAIGFGEGIDAHIVDAGIVRPELQGKGINALLVDVELDLKFPHSSRLFEEAQSGNCKRKFSIGGLLNRDNPRCVTWESGRRVFNDLNIDHIAATRSHKASNDRTGIASAVFKSLDMTDEDVTAIAGDQPKTPYTLRDLAKRFGFPFDGQIVKEVSSAFFSGETESSGATPHVHSFTGRLDGDRGTLIGQTGSWSAGERHAHFVDIMNDEPAVTSGASRGKDLTHTHPLGMANVRQITLEDFTKLVHEQVDDPTMRSKMLQGLDQMKDKKQTPVAAEQATATPPVSDIESSKGVGEQSVSEKVTPDAPAIDAETKEVGSLLRGFAAAAKRVLGSADEDPADMPKTILDFAESITPDFVERGGSVDELAKSVLILTQRFAGITVDREDMAVRTAKLFDTLDSVWQLKLVDEPIEAEKVVPASDSLDVASATNTMASEVEDDQATKTTAEKVADQNQEQDDMEFSKEQIDRLGVSIASGVSTSLIAAFEKGGLLPKTDVAEHSDGVNEDTEVDAGAGDADGDAEGEGSSEGEQKPTPSGDESAEAGAEGETEGAEGAEGADGESDGDDGGEPEDASEKILSAIAGIGSKVEDIVGRVASLEGKPAGRKGTDGQDDDVSGSGSKGIFSGILVKPRS